MSVKQDAEGYWHIYLCVDRRRVHRRLPKGSSRKQALELETKLRQSLETGEVEKDPPLTKIMSLYLAHAKTLRSEETARFHALRMGPWLQGHSASEAKKVAAVMVRDMQEMYKPATINRSLGTLKKALSIAKQQEWISENYGEDIKRLPENNQREVYLSLDEVKAIADCASESVRAAIWIAIYTGMRRGEILKMQPEHIKGDVLVIPAGNTKTLRTRVVPVAHGLAPWLKYIPLPINYEGLKTGFDRARKAAGMPHVHFHDLRHSTASLMLHEGADLYTISKVLGHKTARTSERYAHLKVDQQREALNKVFGKKRL